jgi:hypothetical protein
MRRTSCPTVIRRASRWCAMGSLCASCTMRRLIGTSCGFGLDEIDGPMLRHGLQGFNGERIHAPRAAEPRPAEDFLAERFELFRRAG